MLQMIGTLFLILLASLFYWALTKPQKNLPPGSLGLPFLGQTLSYLRAYSTNRGHEWLQIRASKYGPVSKMNILGMPTVFLSGPAANKFIYTNGDSLLVTFLPPSMAAIFGEKNIQVLQGEEHRRVREAIVAFLKPETLKTYFRKLDDEVKDHFITNWLGRDKVLAIPLFKKLTFGIMCSMIVGVHGTREREAFIELFQQLSEGVIAMPINLPFTKFSRAIAANKRIRAMLTCLLREKRAALRDNRLAPPDLLSSLMLLKNKSDDGKPLLTTDEILDTVVTVMNAGFDSSSSLLAVLVKRLAENPSVLSRIVQEQEEIRGQNGGSALGWEDIAKMKYTWKVAMECLRLSPPFFGFFRRAMKDFEYEGFLIPKGWQVFWAGCSTQRDDKLFTDPLGFEPDRFDQRHAPFSFIPFGGGARICPGYEFARLETLVIVHHLVTKFKWSLCNPKVPLSLTFVPTFADGLEICLELRNAIDT